MKNMSRIKEYVLITFATLIVAAAVFFFLIPRGNRIRRWTPRRAGC